MIPKKNHVILKPISSDKIGNGLLYGQFPDSTFSGIVMHVSDTGCKGIEVGMRVKYNQYAPKIIDRENILVRATDIYFIEEDAPKLIQNRIWVEYDESYKVLDNGLILVKNDQPHLVWGVVKVVGDECIDIKQGDKILFPYGVSVKHEYKGERMLLIRETDIYAIEEGE